MTGWGRLVEDYSVTLGASGRSAGTIRLHRHYLALLVRTYPHGPPTSTFELQRLLADHTWKPETRKSCRTVIRSFYRWAHRAGIVDVDPAASLDPVRVPDAVARPTPESVLVAALAAADDRTRLMLLLAAYAGLRCCEIARVHAADVVDDTLTVTGKGGKVRDVPIEHAELRLRLRGLSGWAFPSTNRGRGPITAAHVSKLLARVLPGGWTAHTLRHRMGTRAYAGSRDLLAVSALLGHSRPETTRRYVQLPDDAIRAAAAAAAS